MTDIESHDQTAEQRRSPSDSPNARGVGAKLTGISHALTEAMDDGHCGLPAAELAPLAVELLEVPKELVQTALDFELAEGTVVADTVAGTPCIFLGGLYRAERAIGERFLKIAGGRLPWPNIDAGKALPWVEGKTGLSLAESQADAVRRAVISKAMVITGGPGVGKTTIVNAILRILDAKGVTLLLCELLSKVVYGLIMRRRDPGVLHLRI